MSTNNGTSTSPSISNNTDIPTLAPTLKINGTNATDEPTLSPPPETIQIPSEPVTPSSTAAWTKLARSFFDVDVKAGPNTGLPSNIVQAIRLRAIGTQNYQCQELPVNGSSSDTVIGWVLRYPLANLWHYSIVNGTVNTSRNPDGIHYSVGAPDQSAGFANMVWDIGRDCNYGNPLNGTSPSCSSYSARWRGKNPKQDPQVGSISFLRLDKDESMMSPIINVSSSSSDTSSFYNGFWPFSSIQRLRTIGGLVSAAGVPCGNLEDVNNTVSSPFEADFIFGLKQVAFPTSSNDTIKLPDDCFQALPLRGQGRVIYENKNGTWELAEQEQHPIQATLYAYSTEDFRNNPPLNETNGTSIDTSSPTGSVGPLSKVIQEDKGRVGHQYTTIGLEGELGLAPSIESYFEVGGGCSDNNMCLTTAGMWEGQYLSTVWNGMYNLPIGLLEGSTAANTSALGYYTNVLGSYSLAQQLLTKGGIPPLPPSVINATNGQLYTADFNSSFIFALCVRDVETTPSAAVNDFSCFFWILWNLVVILVLLLR